MPEQWRERAACRGLGPATFYAEREEGEANHAIEAKRVCVTCEAQIECLDFAVRHSEVFGIWGGVGLDRRTRIRAIYRRGDALAYEQALAAEVESTARMFGVIADDRPEAPERPCERCEATVRAGRHPVDRNGAEATCGLASTYNKGCRCGDCVDAKSDYMRAVRLRKTRAVAS